MAIAYPQAASISSLTHPPVDRHEPQWLVTLRSEARARHLEIGVPTPKHEEWKYTPLRPVAEGDWRAGEPGPAVFQNELPRFEDSSVRVVLVNGRFDRNLSESPPPTPPSVSPGTSHPGKTEGGAPEGLVAPGTNLPGRAESRASRLTVKSLADAVVENADLVEPYLGKVGPMATEVVGRTIEPDVHTFAELNCATFIDGVFVHIPAGVEVAPLIEIVHVASGSGQVFAPRVLIVAEQGAKARIVETYVTDGEGVTLTLPVTEVVVMQSANLEHVRVQDEAETAYHIASWQTSQEKDSEYHSYNVCYGGALARVDQGIWLGGEATTTRLDGVVCAAGHQHMDNHTRLDHALPNGNSFEIYKQVIDDEATVVFNGKIYVHQDAQKTDAKQTNQALLLSPKATIDSKPQLEIFADDVKCTHGATVGQLEDLPLFYMRSRGIPKDEAVAVLVYAFAAEVLELISIGSVRVSLERRLYEKLGVELE